MQSIYVNAGKSHSNGLRVFPLKISIYLEYKYKYILSFTKKLTMTEKKSYIDLVWLFEINFQQPK